MRGLRSSSPRSLTEQPDTQFLLLSEMLGNDAMQIQAAGGNTSAKVETSMWIKASGQWLRDARQGSIFTSVDYRSMRSDSRLGIYKDVSFYCESADVRPSIESSMHAILDYRIVVHTHPVMLMPYLIETDGKERLTPLLSELNWAWVDYARPGWPLTQLLLEVARAGTNVFLLANHGLVVAADSYAEIAALLADIERRVSINARVSPPANFDELNRVMASGWRLPKYSEIHSLGSDPRTFALLQGGIYYPDQVVFLGKNVPVMMNHQRIADVWNAACVNCAGPVAPFIVIPDAGILVRESISAAAEEVLLAHSRILQRVPLRAKVAALKTLEVDELLSWDAEKYRQQLDAERRIAGA